MIMINKLLLIFVTMFSFLMVLNTKAIDLRNLVSSSKAEALFQDDNNDKYHIYSNPAVLSLDLDKSQDKMSISKISLNQQGHYFQSWHQLRNLSDKMHEYALSIEGEVKLQKVGYWNFFDVKNQNLINNQNVRLKPNESLVFKVDGYASDLLGKIQVKVQATQVGCRTGDCKKYSEYFLSKVATKQLIRMSSFFLLGNEQISLVHHIDAMNFSGWDVTLNVTWPVEKNSFLLLQRNTRKRCPFKVNTIKDLQDSRCKSQTARKLYNSLDLVSFDGTDIDNKGGSRLIVSLVETVTITANKVNAINNQTSSKVLEFSSQASIDNILSFQNLASKAIFFVEKAAFSASSRKDEDIVQAASTMKVNKAVEGQTFFFVGYLWNKGENILENITVKLDSENFPPDTKFCLSKTNDCETFQDKNSLSSLRLSDIPANTNSVVYLWVKLPQKVLQLSAPSGYSATLKAMIGKGTGFSKTLTGNLVRIGEVNIDVKIDDSTPALLRPVNNKAIWHKISITNKGDISNRYDLQLLDETLTVKQFPFKVRILDKKGIVVTQTPMLKTDESFTVTLEIQPFSTSQGKDIPFIFTASSSFSTIKGELPLKIINNKSNLLRLSLAQDQLLNRGYTVFTHDLTNKFPSASQTNLTTINLYTEILSFGKQNPTVELYEDANGDGRFTTGDTKITDNQVIVGYGKTKRIFLVVKQLPILEKPDENIKNMIMLRANNAEDMVTVFDHILFEAENIDIIKKQAIWMGCQGAKPTKYTLNLIETHTNKDCIMYKITVTNLNLYPAKNLQIKDNISDFVTLYPNNTLTNVHCDPDQCNPPSVENSVLHVSFKKPLLYREQWELRYIIQIK